MDFVAAAANLRSAAYGIPTQSLFDAKGMAGNIVHAVATTNAVISGLITLEAMKLLAEAPDACKVRGHCAHKLALFWRNLLEILPNGRNAERGRAHHDQAAGAGARRLQGERERCLLCKCWKRNRRHVVATTNAVISRLITLEAIQLLAKAPQACKVGGMFGSRFDPLSSTKVQQDAVTTHKLCLAAVILGHMIMPCCCHLGPDHAGGDEAAGPSARGLPGERNCHKIYVKLISAEACKVRETAHKRYVKLISAKNDKPRSRHQRRHLGPRHAGGNEVSGVRACHLQGEYPHGHV